MTTTNTAPALPALDPAITAQVQDQCRAVVGLCKAVTELHTDYANVIAAGCMSPTLLQMVGERTAKLMEHLGDLLNGMDATTDEDAWMDPIFERAHAMFPVEPERAALAAAPAAAQPSIPEGWKLVPVEPTAAMQKAGAAASAATKSYQVRVPGSVCMFYADKRATPQMKAAAAYRAMLAAAPAGEQKP